MEIQLTLDGLHYTVTIEESKGFDTFTEHLHEMMAVPASQNTAQFIENATWYRAVDPIIWTINGDE